MRAPERRLALVGLGSSLGHRRGHLALAVRLLALQSGVRLLAVSKLYRTPPWGGVARNPFLNAAVLLRVELEPQALLEICKGLEARLGRRRGLRWGDRVLDLDLLWMQDLVIDHPDVRLPHPRIAERSFVVLPLEDVLPGAVDPRTGRSFLALHRELCVVAPSPRAVAVGLLPQPRGPKADRRSSTPIAHRRTP
jgi:2-amino-4-hydroxy-6-hydroxymethyldihydropteridine diphosphokinase